MNHHTLYTIATERYIALREEADGSRRSRPAPAVPSAPPAAIRRLARWVATIVQSPRWPARAVPQHSPEQPIGA